MRNTTIVEKFGASVINAITAFLLSIPFYVSFGISLKWKWSVIAAFFFVELLFFIFGRNLDLGMRLVGTTWHYNYSFKQHFIYNILYTLSFATVLVYIWFPFDLLMINLLCIQLPCILVTGTTLHGFLSGMESAKK